MLEKAKGDPSTESGQPVLDPRRHFVLAVLCLVTLFNLADRQIITVLIEPIKQDFGASDTAMGLLTGMVFAGFYACASIPLARWADMGQRRIVLAGCLCFWSLMTALGGLTQSIVQLAVTRMGVAIGEAGAGPASHSMLADLYPLNSRASVISILIAFSSIGIGLGIFVGGWLSDIFSWRMTLLVVGIPGLLLGATIFFYLPEPERGKVDGIKDEHSTIKFLDGLSKLWAFPTFRCLAVVCTLVPICGYGLLMWGPTFFIRVHGLSGTEAGLGFGLATTVGGIVAALFGGFASDLMGKTDLRWYMRISAIGPLLSLPFALLFLFATNPIVGFISLFSFFALIGFYNAPLHALVQTLAPLRMRATAMVMVGLCSTIGGIGVAPLLIGISNDLLDPYFGNESIRYSMAFVTIAVVFAGFFAMLGSLWIRKDIAITRQPENAEGYGNLAWHYSTAPHKRDRDGKRAVMYAEKLTNISDGADSRNILAAAYAEAGRFDDAITNQEQAIHGLLDTDDEERITECKNRLALYKNGLPYRQDTEKDKLEV